MNDPLDLRFCRRIGPGLLRGADRVLHGGIVAAFLVGLRRRNPSAVVNGVVSLAFASVPGYVGRRYGARLRPWQRLWVSAAALVHAVGTLGPYDRIRWWDDVAHTLSAAVVAGTADVSLRAGAERAGRAAVPPRRRAAVVVGTTLGVGLVWETLEYVVHSLADRVGLEPLLVQYGPCDTVGDLCYDVVGAGLVVLFGRRALANVVASLVDGRESDSTTGETGDDREPTSADRETDGPDRG